MIRRSGNFGFVDVGGGLYSFNLNGGAMGTGWTPTCYNVRGGLGRGYKYITVNGVNIIPYGEDNDLPGYVERILSKFYAGEGILGKKVGLQWGDGPALFCDAVDPITNLVYRQWIIDRNLTDELEAIDFRNQMHRCLIDLVHLDGFWVKFTRKRGARIGSAALASVEHIPASRVRFVWPGSDDAAPTHAMVAEFPNTRLGEHKIYPLYDPANPLRYPVSIGYFSLYSYNQQYYSIPRFVGAFEWLELAGTLAGILSAYNENASAISMHIESPKSYWDDAEKQIMAKCEKMKIPYESRYLEEFKDTAMERFAASMTGRTNAGKFMHTSSFFSEEANTFVGWKVTPIDKKIKDYIEAQVLICRKAEAAATSGFGLDPALSNLILDTKLGSGSEKLYSLKAYNATETVLPDITICKPFQIFLDANHPGNQVKIGFYRRIVDAEQNISPSNRVKENA